MHECCIPWVPCLSAGGNLDSWPTCRPIHADIYMQAFASFPVSHLGERIISRGCLGISRIGPSLGVPSVSPEILLEASRLSANRQWDWTERREGGDTDLCLGMGRSSWQRWICAHALASPAGCPCREAAAGEGVNKQCCIERDGHIDMLQHNQGRLILLRPLLRHSVVLTPLQSHGHSQTASPKQHNNFWPWHWVLLVLEDACQEIGKSHSNWRL